MRIYTVTDSFRGPLERHAVVKVLSPQSHRRHCSARPPPSRPSNIWRLLAHTPTSSVTSKSPRNEVLSLLQEDCSLYQQTPGLEAALERLIQEQGTRGGGTATLKLGQGTWQVFNAPHIARMSQALGTRFQPIQYVLKGNELYSYVRFSSSIFKEGWLSASGSLVASDPDTVQVLFDNFWVDLGSNSLRRQVPRGQAGALSDRIVAALGRIGFLPRLSYFPVLYVDQELAVFSFQPLNSNIAVQRVPDVSSLTSIE